MFPCKNNAIAALVHAFPAFERNCGTQACPTTSGGRDRCRRSRRRGCIVQKLAKRGANIVRCFVREPWERIISMYIFIYIVCICIEVYTSYMAGSIAGNGPACWMKRGSLRACMCAHGNVSFRWLSRIRVANRREFCSDFSYSLVGSPKMLRGSPWPTIFITSRIFRSTGEQSCRLNVEGEGEKVKSST